jgi:hypothetical protein
MISTLLLFCSLLLHCQGEKPDGLTPDEMDLLVETTALLSVAAQQHAGDAAILTVRQDSIFASLGLRRDDYRLLVEKMAQKPERWLEIWERIAERIEETSLKVQ